MDDERLWTWEDIVHLPEHEQPEILSGRPYYRAVPRGTHGHALDVPLPFTSQLLEVMQALKVDGHLEDDHSGIVQYFEKLAQVQVHKLEEK